MDERRQYFRVKNNGEIHASLFNNSLEVVDISSKGALVVKNNIDIPKTGTVTLQIHNFMMELSYELLQVEDEKLILLFNKEEEINKLFVVLKRLRDERNKKI